MELNKNTSYALIAILGGATTSSKIKDALPNIDIRTIQRALERLAELQLLEQSGPANAPVYSVRYAKLLTTTIPERLLIREDRPSSTFNFELIDWLEQQGPTEIEGLLGQDIDTSNNKLSRRDLEHLTVELSWKSSALEGNTYTLLDTNLLLTEGVRPKNRTNFETQMILNHKNAIEFISQHPDEFSGHIRFAAIEELHGRIAKNLAIEAGVRKKTVQISASNYTPLSDPNTLREQADRVLKLISRQSRPFTRALLALTLIPYLQPFEDGNKRTGRLLANAILISTVGRGFSLRSTGARTLALAYLRFYEFNSMVELKKILSNELRTD